MKKSKLRKTVSSLIRKLGRYAKELLRKLIRASGLVEFAARERRTSRRRRVAPAH